MLANWCSFPNMQFPKSKYLIVQQPKAKLALIFSLGNMFDML